MTNENLKKVYEHHNLLTLNSYEIEPSNGIKNPHKIKKIILDYDFYALTWISLKFNIWENKNIRGEKIYLGPADFFWIHMNFIIFIIFLIGTISLILYEIVEIEGYIASSFTILLLRVTLVYFAQKSLSPEFNQGLFLIRYSYNNKDKFSHYQFAIFVGVCQVLVISFVFFGIMLFVCTSIEALDLVVEFAGLSIIAKLDNWIGECIILSKPKNEEEEEEEGEKKDSNLHKEEEITRNQEDQEFYLKNLNIRMTLNQKMALIEEEDMILQDDQNIILKSHWSIKLTDRIINFCNWQYFLPLFTLVFNYLMPLIRPKIDFEE
jgi:hypothetical protein